MEKQGNQWGEEGREEREEEVWEEVEEEEEEEVWEERGEEEEEAGERGFEERWQPVKPGQGGSVASGSRWQPVGRCRVLWVLVGGGGVLSGVVGVRQSDVR